MTWSYEGELRARLANEKNFIVKSGGRLRFALAYPNFYRVGMSNLGIHIIYELLNSRLGVSCERFFLPEQSTLEKISRAGLPPLSLETQTPLNKFQVIGFAVSFEPDYFNVVKMLRLSKIKLRASERTDFDPILIAGGACATFNPEPLAEIFDAFVIGEGEVILPPLIDEIISTENLPRLERLERLSNLAGVYVPAFPKKVSRQWVKNLDEYPAHSVILTDDAEFNMYLVETARGCGRHCRFCMAGYCFRKPRNRSLDVLKSEILSAKQFGKKIGLMGAAISDYPQIDELCKFILGERLQMSVASFRADSVTFELVKSLAASGLKTLTIAPEVGSEKMRLVVNKGITEENIFNAVELGLKAGIKNFRLYFMTGLPFEELSDVEEIAKLSARIKKFCGQGRLTLSVNPFVPKPFTPFQWAKFAGKKYLDAAFKILRGELKSVRGVEIISESVKASEIQAILSRGDRKISEIILQSETPQEFKKNFKAAGLDENYYLREIPFEENLAWDFLNQGFGKKYLIDEFKRAENLKSTARCFEGCKRCGVCEVI
ncbi:MAG: radical SAM protein [Selenomonadaceae bacterium]|nr:radical SAM protein [Selenomonadaceae bacterium]